MGAWGEVAVAAAAVAIALAALLATLAYRRRSEQKRDFQLLLERSDRTAVEWRERSDRESQEWRERSDRKSQEWSERFDRESQEWRERSDRESQEWRERFERESAKREKATQALMERIDAEAAKRESAIQAAWDRSDRKFEALLASSSELAKGLAGIAERTARNEGALDGMTAGKRGTASQSTSVADDPRAVAAQQVPGEPPPE